MGSDDAGASPAWSEAKCRAILGAFATFLHNQAAKHGVAADAVRERIRDELPGPGDGR